MARHGDGLYLRGQTWYRDCRNRVEGGLSMHAAVHAARPWNGQVRGTNGNAIWS